MIVFQFCFETAKTNDFTATYKHQRNLLKTHEMYRNTTPSSLKSPKQMGENLMPRMIRTGLAQHLQAKVGLEPNGTE